MKPIKTMAAALCTALTLNGCTMFLWGHNDPFSKSSRHHEVAKDEIQAFGMVRRSNSQLAQGSLVMMGKNNWFVVNPADSAKLQGVLDVKLDKAFQIVGEGSHKPLESFPVSVKSAQSNDFATSFCLRYDTAKASDIAKLKALSFKEYKPKDADKGSVPYYIRCETASGKFYQSPPDYRVDYRFETPFPVSVGYTETIKHTDGGKLVHNIFWTPVALAGDAALAVVALVTAPLYLLSR